IESEVAYEAPRNEVEEVLSSIFAEVLQKDRVGIHDNFFELGGHSLRAMKLINEINKKTNKNISVAVLFENPTPYELANQLKKRKRLDYAPLEKQKGNIFPVTSQQQRLFLIQEMEPESITYNMPTVFTLKGDFTVEDIKKAFKKLLERHESLRTSFSMKEGELVQEVHEEVEFEVNYLEYDLDNFDVDVFYDQEVKFFNLSEAPLIRASIIGSRSNEFTLFIDMHHIISDGESAIILINDLYKILSNEKLKPIRTQYKDYSVWFNNKGLEESEKYWASIYEEQPDILELPLDFPRTQRNDHAAGRFKAEISETTSEKIKNYCRKYQLTENMFLFAGFMILLSKYSGQEDVVVGMPVAGRIHPDTENMVGMFVNSLAIRAYPNSAKSVQTFMQEMKNTIINSLEHQDYPLENLVNMIGGQRDVSRNPLFDVFFAYQNTEGVTVQSEDVGIKLESQHVLAKFDIDLNIAYQNPMFELTVVYNDELFLDSTIQAMIDNYIYLIEEIINTENSTIAGLSMLSKDEESRILYEFNNPDAEREVTDVISLFEKQAEAHPFALALKYDDEVLTYRQLNRRANALAHELIKLKVKRGDPVLLKASPSFDMVVGLLAILKAGACYVPIDDAYPKERIEYIISDSGADYILNNQDHENDLQAQKIDIKNYEKEKDENILKRTPEDIAYILYTSGTTGKPKGTLITDGNITNLVIDGIFKFSPRTCMLQTVSVAFDPSIPEFFGTLLNGGLLVLADRDEVVDPKKLKTLICNNEINSIMTTTSIFNQMIDIDETIYENLDFLMVGGDAASIKHMVRLVEINPNIRLFNGYGPTENTTISTVLQISTDLEKMTIGKPIPGVQVYIVRDEKLCPVGVPGEICLAGNNLSAGYFNKPDQNKSAFLENPWGADRIYKTGDKGKWLANGEIDFLGRIDHQVKIRGYRIELDEIKNALLKIKGVNDLVVNTVEENGSKQIAAYIVGNFDHDEASVRSIIQNELKEFLPHYMIPQYFMFINEIPLTINGKVDTGALPDIKSSISTTKKQASSEMEIELARVYAEVLSREEYGIDDNFFDYGGDSIKAMQVVSKIRELGYRVEIKDVLQRPTIEEIIPYLIKHEDLAMQSEISGEFGTTPIQREFMSWNLANENHYNQAFVLEFDINLSEQILFQSLEEVVKHHDMLRATKKENKNYIHSISDGLNFAWKVIETETKLLETDIFEHGQMLQENMNVTDGPVFGAVLLKTEEKSYLVLAAHHWVVDAVSWRIIVEDIMRSYQGFSIEGSVKLPHKTASYADWVEAINKYDWLQDKAFWDKQLAANDLEHVEPSQLNGQLLSATMEFDGYPKGFAKSYGVSDETLFLAVFMRTFYQWKDLKNITIRMESHGRSEYFGLELDRTVGWFTSVYALGLEYQNNFKEMLRSIDQNLNEVPNLGISYLLYKENNIDVTEPQILFNYLGDYSISNDTNASFKFSNMLPGNSIDEENQINELFSFDIQFVDSTLIANVKASNYFSQFEVNQFMKIYEDVIKDLVEKTTDFENSEVFGIRNVTIRKSSRPIKENNKEQSKISTEIRSEELDELRDIFGN
ncbi:MAG TPA: amino acid adenylation domain-containing protein, partial [Clostridiaceae bacterium]|nr:amino acid adenylation domain-containing protein [Clostridiaceae bacterium]